MSEKYQKSDLTKKRILLAARTLFNDRGTSTVSTNLIAAEAGLSPGNLYYHFRNKKDIIRNLLEDYAKANEHLWVSGKDPAMELIELRENLLEAMRISWDYRFFEREILALLRADSKLKEAYTLTYKHRLEQWKSLGEHLVSSGMVRSPKAPSTIEDLALGIWLIGQSWVPFLDITGDPSDAESVARGADLLLAFLDPYLTDAGSRAIMDVTHHEVDSNREEKQIDFSRKYGGVHQ